MNPNENGTGGKLARRELLTYAAFGSAVVVAANQAAQSSAAETSEVRPAEHFAGRLLQQGRPLWNDHLGNKSRLPFGVGHTRKRSEFRMELPCKEQDENNSNPEVDHAHL